MKVMKILGFVVALLVLLAPTPSRAQTALSCAQTANDASPTSGSTYTCPTGCSGSGTIYGDHYNPGYGKGGLLCRSAIHAGAIPTRYVYIRCRYHESEFIRLSNTKWYNVERI